LFHTVELAVQPNSILWFERSGVNVRASMWARDMRVHFAEVAGVRTRWYAAGRGDPLVLLHGVGVPAEIWISVIPRLAEQHLVLAPDLLGCGFTEGGAVASIAPHGPMLDHLEAWLEHLGISGCSVLGSSFGAVLATHLHLRRPDRVGALVLVSSGSAFLVDADLREMYARVRINGLSAFDDPTLANCRLRLARVLGGATQPPDALLTAQMISCALPDARDAFLRRVDALADIDCWRPWRVEQRFADVTAPVLAIFGGKDPRANVGQGRERLAALRNPADVVVFPESGHYPQIEEPDRFCHITEAFVQKHQQSFGTEKSV
jgi:2-hydroxy-6-oxonona-2,4-dienedioate hydrolase